VTTFVFDTNAVEQLGHYYPSSFPTFWDHFAVMVKERLAISVREVQRELERRDHKAWLRAWLKEHPGFFTVPGPAETAFVAEIFRVKHFQALVGERQRLQGTPVADPFVIAAARTRKGSCVVTQETLKPNAAKIPNVCDRFGIDWTDFEGFLKRNGWSY